jgi:hypothetical protein
MVCCGINTLSTYEGWIWKCIPCFFIIYTCVSEHWKLLVIVFEGFWSKFSNIIKALAQRTYVDIEKDIRDRW